MPGSLPPAEPKGFQQPGPNNERNRIWKAERLALRPPKQPKAAMTPPPGNFLPKAQLSPRPPFIKGKGKGLQKPTKADRVCFQFRDTGKCSRGANCPFKHS